jgi:hypothetical protein
MLASVRGTPYRRVERLYYEYIQAQRAEVASMLDRLSGLEGHAAARSPNSRWLLRQQPTGLEASCGRRRMLCYLEMQPVKFMQCEMRLLAEKPLRFRRQVLALKQFFAARKATVLLLEELILNGNGRDLQLLSLSGVIRLERWTLDFGGARRRVEITKMRGTTSREGWHDYKIRTGGSRCFRLWSRLSMWVPLSGSQCRAVLPNSMRCSTAVRFEAQAPC